MKKIILPIFVALMATVSFSSCEKEETTDADLKAELQNSVYTGSNSQGDYTLNLQLTTFELDEPNTVEGLQVWQNVSTGTWTVTDGQLIMLFTEIDGASVDYDATVEIERKGKQLQFPTWDGASYNGATVLLKK